MQINEQFKQLRLANHTVTLQCTECPYFPMQHENLKPIAKLIARCVWSAIMCLWLCVSIRSDLKDPRFMQPCEKLDKNQTFSIVSNSIR